MIKVYPSRLEGEPLELHPISERTTMREWLSVNAPECDTSILTLHLNGHPADLDTTFCPSDTMEVFIEPRGVAAAIVMAVVAVVVAVAMRPKIPKQRDQAQGQPLRSASLTGNTARYGEPIPEIFGSPPRIYPDYLVPARTYYASPKVQWIEAFLCVGRGEFQKSTGDVYIGDTRAPALGDDVQIQFYEPGEDVSGETAADWWHTPKEVGFTSRGGAGLELGTLSDRTDFVDASAFAAAGNIISIASGSDFPDDWTAGVELRIEVPYPATVTAGARDIIESEHAFSHFTPVTGMAVELGGDEDGVYIIHSYTPPSGTIPPVPGTPSTYTASSAPARLDFGITPAGFTINAPAGNFTVYLSNDYASDADLLQAINAQLNSTSVVASLESGLLRISERNSPYSGGTIYVTGDAATDLFGSNPVSAPGIKTEPEKPAGAGRITLSTMDGLPVTDLAKGQIQLAVAPEGMTYEVTQRVTDRALEVDGADWASVTSGDISVSLGIGSQSVGWTGPFAVTPPGELCDAFEIDYTFPSGLIHYNKKGNKERIPATIFVEWREFGGPWQSRQYDHLLAEPDGIGFTHRIELDEPAEIEVRLRRSPKIGWKNNSEDIQWTGLRGRMLSRPNRYDGVTTLAVKLRTGDRVSSQADNKIWLKATRILPLIEGGSGPTRDIAPALQHVLSACGYGDRIDRDALEELHEIWQPRLDRFDFAAISHSTVKRLANDILRAGFAELTIDRGLLTPVRDARREAPNYIYSPQEFLDYPTVTTELVRPDDIDGVDAEYIDEHTGQPETVQYRLLGDEGRRAEKIKLVGVTNWTRAWRIAARHRRILAYRRTSFKGTTELHALNSSYMSYDRIQDGVPEYGQSCFVTAIDGLVIHVSEPLEFDGNANRVIALRQLDGRVTRPVWVKPGPVPESVELLEPLPFEFDWSLGGSTDPTMLYFGSVRTWAHDVLVTSISPKQDNTVDISAVVYDDRVYMDDDRDPQNEVYLTSETYEAEEQTSEVYEAEDATSTLYPLEFDDSLAPSAAAPSASWGTPPMDSMTVSMLPPAVYRRAAVRYLTYDKAEPESLGIAMLAPSVSRVTQVRYLTYTGEPESMAVAMLPPAVFRQKVADYLEYTIPEESLAVAMLAPAVSIEFGVDIWEAPTNLTGVFEDE